MLEEYAAEQIPQVCAKLRALSFDFALFSTNWLLCVFINCLPWDCVLRVLDILLVERDAQVPPHAAASRALHACMAAHARCVLPVLLGHVSFNAPVLCARLQAVRLHCVCIGCCMWQLLEGERERAQRLGE